MPTYRPVDAAELLGVSTSTLRRWAQDFAEHLSASASPDAGSRRRFTTRDIAVLRHAKALLDARNATPAVNDLLRLEDFGDLEADQAAEAPATPPQAQDASTALVSLLGSQVITAQADQAQRVTYLEQRLASVESQLADLRVLVARLEAMLEALTSSEHDHPAIVPTRRRRRSST